MKRLAIALLAILLPLQAWSQATVLQGGSWTAGRPPMYSSSGGGSQPVIQQSAPASGGSQSLSELSLIARGTGTAPYTGQGTGYLGSIACLYDGPTTGAYHQLCLSPSATGGFGLLSYNAFGGASAQDLKFDINGTVYTFPFSDGFVVGPGSSTVGHAACWNNTAGTLLSDCGSFPTPGGTSGQVQFNSGGTAFGGFTVGGDGTLNTSTGALTVSKIGNVSITLGGTFTTSGASALTLTTTGATNVTLPTTGTLVTLAGAEALTNKTYNGNSWTAGTGTLAISAAKTFTATNTLTLAGTDSSTLNIGTGGTLGTAAYTATTAYMPTGVQIRTVLGANVTLNNTGTFFDGPSIAQGSTGTWFACGTVSVQDTAGSAQFAAKLWDGTTVIAAGFANTAGPSGVESITLCGYLASPAGNIRMSAKDATSTSGLILFNGSGVSADSSIWAFRVQ